MAPLKSFFASENATDALFACENSIDACVNMEESRHLHAQGYNFKLHIELTEAAGS